MTETSPTTRGRILATLYLFVLVAGITAQVFIADSLIVVGNASATAANIRANMSLYRLGFTIFMMEMIAQVTVIAMFYDLLKPVNRRVARLAAAVGFTGAGIKTMARLFYYAPLLVLGGSTYQAAMPPAQLEAFSMALIDLNTQGAAIALIFFGFESLLQGWLVFKSEFLPRFLGVISMIGGLGWLAWFWPPLGYQTIMFVALFALVGVIAMSGWLFIRGVDDAKWRARAAALSR